MDASSLMSNLRVGGRDLLFVDPVRLAAQGLLGPRPLPYCLRVLLENAVRNASALALSGDEIARIGGWQPGDAPFSLPLFVTRVILPDSSGLPALMDLAALRSELVRLELDPEAAEPRIPVDLVVDHSLIVDSAGHPGAADFNMAKEFARNGERYSFLKWAQQAFRGLNVVPPGMGIVHQVHLEHIARVIGTEERDGRHYAFPEFVLGGDSHTPMVNGLGVLAWGVGGIEAEAAILGQPYLVRVGGVVGVRLSGSMRPGTTSTDLVLALTQRLREHGVVGRFVEFFGPGAESLPVSDRATIANMAPEYGATTGYFPIDQRTIEYLRLTGRDEDQLVLVEKAARAGGLFRTEGAPEPAYSEIIHLDLDGVAPSVAGPRRPQDRLDLAEVGRSFSSALTKPIAEGGFGLPDHSRAPVEGVNPSETARHGAIAIAAITSCTNTSNPSLMIAAGLLARRAAERGLRPPPWVKTSLAPGSRVVTRYLENAGLLEPLERLGFHVVGYGCTTCSGKSGEIDSGLAAAVETGLIAAAVLSGNRNFEGRIHRLVKASYLMSPALVVAYALAGHVDVDLTSDPLGVDLEGRPVKLSDLWPAPEEIARELLKAQDPRLYRANYSGLREGTGHWRSLKAASGPVFPWTSGSTYIVEPPFFARQASRDGLGDGIDDARVLGLYADSLTTDHICPAGEIPSASAAGRYLASRGVPPSAFNAYTQRRGNHEVMVRAMFANPRIRNLLDPGLVPGETLVLPEREAAPVHQAAQAYRERGTPMIVMAGRDYGMGSSRDWAAKGPALLGVRAVIAESFERIHRSNLVALGILPLRFVHGETWRSLGLDGTETYTITGLLEAVTSGAAASAKARRDDGKGTIGFSLVAEVENQSEAQCLIAGGLFAQIADQMLAGSTPAEAMRAGALNGGKF